ncbi:MAG: 4a-hydroxytetrahydrobiopterin dehydratase [Myxococcota bacterium]
MELLSDAELDAALAGMPGWRREGRMLVRSVEAPSFLAAVKVLQRVALVAEAREHHPDVDLRHRTVKLALHTWDAGGITALDVELARALNPLLEGM